MKKRWQKLVLIGVIVGMVSAQSLTAMAAEVDTSDGVTAEVTSDDGVEADEADAADGEDETDDVDDTTDDADDADDVDAADGLEDSGEEESLEGEWREDEQGTRFQYSDGTYAKNKLVTVEEEGGPRNYYFDENGYMVSGCWKYIDVSHSSEYSYYAWYYFDADGAAHVGWLQQGSDWYYFDEDGWMISDDVYYIDGQSYFFGSDGRWASGTGWKSIKEYYYDNKYVTTWFYCQDGKVLTGWSQIGGKWYWFSAYGRMITGGITIDKKVYFFDSNGVWNTKAGWKSITVNGYTEWYYGKADGYLLTGWQKFGNTWYYFDKYDGSMADYEGCYIDGKAYAFDKSGALYTGWKNRDDSWYYYDENGRVSGWKKIDGNWYWFEEYGVMFNGEEKEINGVTYKFKSSGALYTGWYKEGTGEAETWYYYDANGVVKSDWKKINGSWYWFDEDGIMAVNTEKEIGDATYRFNGSGAMVTGWYQEGTTWYYYTNGGRALTGWVQSGSNWHWIENGRMNTEEYAQTDAGKWSRFSSDGKGIWKGYAPDYQP